MKKVFLPLIAGLALSTVSQAQETVGVGFQDALDLYQHQKAEAQSRASMLPRSDFLSCNDQNEGSVYVESSGKIIVYGLTLSNDPGTIYCAELRDSDHDGIFTMKYIGATFYPELFSNSYGLPEFDKNSNSIYLENVMIVERDLLSAPLEIKHMATAKIIQRTDGDFEVPYVKITRSF